jgi:transposase
MSVRRHHSKEAKLKVIKEAISTGNVSIVARRYELSASLVSKWVRQYKKDGEAAFNKEAGRQVAAPVLNEKEYFKLEKENEQLKKILGEKDLEVAILRDLIKKKSPLWPTK